MCLEWMLYLQNHGYLTNKKNKLLDIGSQNIYFATNEQVKKFLINQGESNCEEKFKDKIDKIIYFSTPREGERTTYLSELTDLTNIEYNSFDVCPALKTEILDLNFDSLPVKYNNYYDVIINFGTTEHVLNQLNSFKIIHDSAKVGGVFYHQLPSTGYLDHGYYCYTPLFFKALAEANGYEILDLFFNSGGQNKLDQLAIKTRKNQFERDLNEEDKTIPCFNINIILKKLEDKPFCYGFDIATSHSAIDPKILSKYSNTTEIDMLKSQVNELGFESIALKSEIERLNFEISSILSSRSWRMTALFRRGMDRIKRLNSR